MIFHCVNEHLLLTLSICSIFWYVCLESSGTCSWNGNNVGKPSQSKHTATTTSAQSPGQHLNRKTKETLGQQPMMRPVRISVGQNQEKSNHALPRPLCRCAYLQTQHRNLMLNASNQTCRTPQTWNMIPGTGMHPIAILDGEECTLENTRGLPSWKYHQTWRDVLGYIDRNNSVLLCQLLVQHATVKKPVSSGWSCDYHDVAGQIGCQGVYLRQ